jgi:hypothetical protein
MPSAGGEIAMPEIGAWESSAREVRLPMPGLREVAGQRQIAHTAAADRSATRTVPRMLRSRSRTRSRRRKRSWAYLLQVFIAYGTFWISLALFREDIMARIARKHMELSRRTKKLKRRDCLRCDREFWSEGPHHRLCQTCRQVIAASPSPTEEYSVVSHHEPGIPDPLHAGRLWY